MPVIVRVFAVAITIIATYWFGLTYSWEAFFTAASFVLVYLGAETYGRFRGEERHAADRELFKKLQEEFPFDPSIRFLQDHDLRVAFQWSELKAVGRFVGSWTDESHKFHNKQLERGKENLRTTCRTLMSELSRDTFPRESNDLQGIPQEWLVDQKERYEEVSTRLNARADEVVKKHQDFFQLARRKLNM
jgi:hypothetical protein